MWITFVHENNKFSNSFTFSDIAMENTTLIIDNPRAHLIIVCAT